MASSELWAPATPPVEFRIFCPVDLLALQGRTCMLELLGPNGGAVKVQEPAALQHSVDDGCGKVLVV